MQTAEKALICERCGHEWQQRGPVPPVRCPKCSSTIWRKMRPVPVALPDIEGRS